MALILCLVGPQGSGKGTLAKGLGYKIVEAGALLRAHAYGGGKIYPKEDFEAGKMAPSELTCKLVVDGLRGIIKELDPEVIVLDGFPRNSTQARYLAEMMKSEKLVRLNLLVPRAQCEARLQARGRADDTVVGIKARLDNYFTNTISDLDAVQWAQDEFFIETSDRVTTEEAVVRARCMIAEWAKEA